MNGLNFIRKLGGGAFGSVWLAEEKKTGQKVVYKKIKSGLEDLKQQQALKYMGRESITLETIKRQCNPYLSCIRGVEAKAGLVTGLIMDYVPDSYELFSFLQENRVSFYAKLTIILQLLNGLNEIHNLGVVHRDIKVENILITPKNMGIRYIDFGGSCVKLDKECLDESFGTPATFSPELQERKRLTFRGWKKSDIWSLGVTFVDIAFFDEFKGMFFEHPKDTLKSKDEDYVPITLSREVFRVKRPNPKDLLLIKIISLMLRYDPDARPSADRILDVLGTDMEQDVNQAIGNMSFADVRDRAIAEMSVLNINPNTRIFPGERRHSEPGKPKSPSSRTTF